MGLVFRINVFFLALCQLSCGSGEDKDDLVIAVEKELFDVYIREGSPNNYDFNSASYEIGHFDSGESRYLLQIPQFENLYDENLIASSVAEILVEMSVVSVSVNPENIRLAFVSESWSPFASWNSRMALKRGFEWQQPGGDYLDLEEAIPDIEKDGVYKKLKFDITQQVVSSIEDGAEIFGFAIRVVESELNGSQNMTFITFNAGSANPPRATLTFVKPDVLN